GRRSVSVQPVQSWKCSQITGGRITFPSAAATSSGVFLSVIARPNGAAIIREEQNWRNPRRLMPHRIRRSSMVSRTLEESTRGPSIRPLRLSGRAKPNLHARPFQLPRSEGIHDSHRTHFALVLFNCHVLKKFMTAIRLTDPLSRNCRHYRIFARDGPEAVSCPGRHLALSFRVVAFNGPE